MLMQSVAVGKSSSNFVNGFRYSIRAQLRYVRHAACTRAEQEAQLAVW